MVKANALMNKEIAKTAKQNVEAMIGILCDLCVLFVQTVLFSWVVGKDRNVIFVFNQFVLSVSSV